MANNTITDNGAGSGGGLALSSSSPTIANNTIARNNASRGGGLYLTGSSSSPIIANTIVAFNSSGVFRYSGAPTLRYNCVYGNGEYDYDGLDDPTGTDSNISDDPLLADAQYGNVHIQPSSPCADAGSNIDTWGGFDVDGDPRTLGGTVDIGADESDDTVWPAGPYTVVRVSPLGNDANDGSSWALAKRTVQAGIDAASDLGGEVWVRAGTYEERVRLHPLAYVYGGFAGSETAREQREWDANVTTLDGQQRGSVVTARVGYRASAIDGFTITNGSDGNGGGLHLFGSSPTISNNTIVRNSASQGGGLHLGWSYAMITNNRIMNNTTTGSTNRSDGGGLYIGSSSPTIANNTITGNLASNGGGLYLNSSSPTVANNTITDNLARAGGGGLYLNSSSPTIANTLVVFNSSGIHQSGGTATLKHNCVYGNTDDDYLGLDDPTGTDGNISEDPLLADAQYGNVHIQPGSPCADSGSNIDTWGDFDVDGDPRTLGGTVDIGADESDGTVWPAGPYTVVRVSPTGKDASNGSSWGRAKRTVQAGIDAASLLGGDVWVKAGTYEERITLHPYARVYGGFAGIESVREQRDWNANITTLDGQQQGSVVAVLVGCGVSAIDGFTITNGSASHGGGLYLSGSSPTVENNTIAGNSGGAGGGLYLIRSSAKIANNAITGNTANGLGGGGLYLSNSSPTIANNAIRGNRASDGGRLYLDGGGLYLEYSSPTITNNTIVGNSAPYCGGGLSLRDSTATIANNTITGNSVGNYGGGLCLRNGSSATIANTIVAFNSSGLDRIGGFLTLRYNCVYGNTEYDYDGIDDPTGTDGNISMHPLFVQDPYAGPDAEWGTEDDEMGDLRPLSGSPCCDAGDNDAVPSDAADLDGDDDTTEPLPFDFAGGPRFIDAPYTPDMGSGTPPIVDIGAYEYHPGNCDGVGVVTLADFAGLPACLMGVGFVVPAQCDCADMDVDGDVDLADFAALQRTIVGR